MSDVMTPDASLAVPKGKRIDAHMHVWTLGEGRYSWLTRESGALFATWTPEEARSELAAAGMAGAVLVQAEDSEIDTDFMLDVAAHHTWVRGVVGWVDLTNPGAAAAQLDRWQVSPEFCGVRHLLNDDPRDLVNDERVIASLAEVARRGLAFDLHDPWPRFLPGVGVLADRLPDLRIVVDHLGKPPRGDMDFTAWKRALVDAAARANVSAKLSGLRLRGQPFTVEALRETRDHALDCFGAGRLMYGGDWPMAATEGGYPATWRVMAQLMGELSSAEQTALLSDTAMQTYNLRPRVELN